MLEVLFSLVLIVLVLFSLLTSQSAILKQTLSMQFKVIARQQLLNLAEIVSINSPRARQTLMMPWEKNTVNVLPDASFHITHRKQHTCNLGIRWRYQKMFRESQAVYCA